MSIRKIKGSLAPRARFELATLRLTAECSTIELPGNCFVAGQDQTSYDSAACCANSGSQRPARHAPALAGARPNCQSQQNPLPKFTPPKGQYCVLSAESSRGAARRDARALPPPMRPVSVARWVSPRAEYAWIVPAERVRFLSSTRGTRWLRSDSA